MKTQSSLLTLAAGLLTAGFSAFVKPSQVTSVATTQSRATLAGAALTPVHSGTVNITGVKPNLTYATPGLATRMQGYFAAKSAPSVDGVMSYYSRSKTMHNDAVFGFINPNWQAIHDLFAQYMPHFNGAVAYTPQLLGDERSAIVYVANTPAMFGGDMQAISVVDFDESGKISRFVDYFDGRQYGAVGTAKMSVPKDKFPTDFGELNVPNNAAPEMQQLVNQLSAGLRTGQIDEIAPLLAEDAVLEDWALRLQLHGKPAIVKYLQRTIGNAPYGKGSAVRHVVGSRYGGGYEWANPEGPIKRGITALGLNQQGQITKLSTVYNSLALSNAELAAAVQRAYEPGYK